MITGAVEGDADEALLRRVVSFSGLQVGNVYGRQGKPKLLQAIGGYNNSARFSPWVILVDLDQDFPCPAEALRAWLPAPAPHMRLRIAVRSLEAWVLGDRERVAEWLGVSTARVPEYPDEIDHPKRALVNLARFSRSRKIKQDMVPREGAGRIIGPLFTSRLIQFVEDEQAGWRPHEARQRSGSLARCLSRLAQLAGNCKASSPSGR